MMPSTPRFAPDTPVREALAEFFRINNFPPDGGVASKWVRLEFRPFPIYFPIVGARKKAVVLHDMHHVAAPFDTTWTGEAEIAAWEVGGSCRGYLAAWALNMGALTYGVFIAPRRIFRAFVRGRRGLNLYYEGYSPALQNETIGSLRARLRLDDPVPRPTAADAGAFVLWVLLSWLLWDIPILVAAALVVWWVARWTTTH
jgi:hypothetical protein